MQRGRLWQYSVPLIARNMKTKEDEFIQELEVFRTEVDASIQFFYTDLQLMQSLVRIKKL